MINLINKTNSDHHVNIFSSKLKQNIIKQAASMLLQHVTFEKQFSHHLTKNSNGNALDERLHLRRTSKCNSWLSKSPRKIDRSVESRHCHPLTLSTNAAVSQPLIMIQKKHLRLSSIQNCIQPPYSQNHFYVFDQLNLLKLQQHSKRKYSENDLISSKKLFTSSPETADHISINKYHDNKQQSEIILSHLEKILNLCTELRSLANDVESHLNEKQTTENSEERIMIDIYKEFEIQETINEKNTPPLDDISSIHSETNQSHPLMQTESFKTNSQTKLREPEDICSCFLKSIFEKQNCKLNSNEQEYLNQLTKAYLLGREQILKEQHEEYNNFQAFLNESLPDPNEFNTNNNNLLSSSSPIRLNNSTVSLNQQQSSNPSEVMTIKHQIFINEPIAMKTTNVLPGIGIKYAEQLAEYGFSTVKRLLGFYLMVKDDENFVNWLNSTVQISIHSAWLCTNALKHWCQTHL